MATATTAVATATTSAAAPTGSVCNASMYEIPVDDAACAVPNKSNYEDAINECAGDAPVESYANDCAFYALSIDQTVEEFTNCLYEHDVAWQDVFCNGNTTATATGTARATRTSSDESESGTSTSTSASETTAEGAAASLIKEQQPSRFALSVLGFLVSAVIAGAAL
ncbi:hypothetical protein VTO42DRAFT_6359 [Malbranchea cinnamomea]